MPFGNLEFFIKIFLLFLVANILLTLCAAQWRRSKNRRKKLIEAVFADKISDFLYPQTGKKPSFIDVQRALRKVGVREERPENVQFLIQLMIRTQQALGGSNRIQLKRLYGQIPPYRASIDKLRKRDPFQKALGIKEIYEMDQNQYIKQIAAYRDHKNIYLRREAQIALVSFLGWDSLRFLPYLSRKISLWQQIKIVEKLHDVCREPKVEYLHLAYKTKNPDAIELIIRIIKKFYLLSEVDYVFLNLKHPSYEVRKAAIYCLLSLKVRDGAIAERLVRVMDGIPSKIQRKQVLKYLAKGGHTIPTLSL
ncbi:hypothetical protein [Flagellimonas halotolerans]|uniref:HEAT repeat domain-containing protein n=1 Tax=Flagellimonas halotolerans TaxID=3112164 RepID=A0ABU6IV53_9FLAO|nr:MULTISPECIES: hypothetical protein [unclassified Allomuricauda]MEC3967096.1 hypothetical protein [Muricauda sp. SYSU M86414]MEC4266959.1 hypothetical protein [Muricauda sp. SYSU M84420]